MKQKFCLPVISNWRHHHGDQAVFSPSERLQKCSRSSVGGPSGHSRCEGGELNIERVHIQPVLISGAVSTLRSLHNETLRSTSWLLHALDSSLRPACCCVFVRCNSSVIHKLMKVFAFAFPDCSLRRKVFILRHTFLNLKKRSSKDVTRETRPQLNGPIKITHFIYFLFYS